MSLLPLVAICGTTGVGKSKLAIEIALALSGRITNRDGTQYTGARVINADAMQVYAGLDVITNKVTVQEQCGIEHLLMGSKPPHEQYVVGQWVNDAMSAISETHRRSQIPIVVGGTAYWIQHLIFPGKLGVFDEHGAPTASPRSPSTTLSAGLSLALSALPVELRELYQDLPEQPPIASIDPSGAVTLHRLLSALDPPVAQRWHWKDTRKVIRSLRIMKESGRLVSEMISSQSEHEPPPRYRTLCIWLYAKPEVLEPRLDARVDVMLKQGLLDEVGTLLHAATQDAQNLSDADGKRERATDYTLGLYQSIGYREFSSYLLQYNDRNPTQDNPAFLEAVNRMKMSTRQYARRQVKWMRNKLLPAVHAANERHRLEGGHTDIVPTFLLDATELDDKWKINVQSPAIQIMEAFLDNKPLPEPTSLSATAREVLEIADKPTNPSVVLHARQKQICTTCTEDLDQPIMIEQGHEWTTHIQSKRHRKMAQIARRKLSKTDANNDFDT